MIPGSSLKGMISTALKERINQLRSIGSKEEARLLGGDFDKSPMRFLKVGDMQLRTPQAATRLYYADRVHKKDAEPLGIGNGFEAVVPGFYRQFEGEVVLTSGQNTLGIEKVYKTVTEILKDLHAYSMLVLLSQTFFYSKAAPAWLESIMKLLAELKPQFESGRLALVRLGKNTGAESKTRRMRFPADLRPALPQPISQAMRTKSLVLSLSGGPFLKPIRLATFKRSKSGALVTHARSCPLLFPRSGSSLRTSVLSVRRCLTRLQLRRPT